MSKFPLAMDLGCLDLGCISVSDKGSGGGNAVDSHGREANSGGLASSASKSGQIKSPKETTALNKSQKKKPSQRKTSPLGWFPRRKVDSYLNRKIKMLQEVDGMNLTLDETLGDSSPHYCRVLREQMAAREAAHKAMESRKAALVEASWCRILRAARIQSKEAEALMLKAEEAAAEAFEAATAMGVIMYDKPNSSRKRCQIETSAGSGGGSPTHTVTASFETAFEVDKEVTTAVKTAFARLANCPSFSKDDFKELLRKISENPDAGDNREISEISSECETESDSELETLHLSDEAEPEQQKSYFQAKQLKTKRRQSFGKFNMEKLVDMMYERLQGLQEDELSSLATIVATCGLNAALTEVGNQKPHIEPYPLGHDLSEKASATGTRLRRDSNFECFMEGKTRRKQTEIEIPSLDKFLVKHMTKLEKEVHEAKKASTVAPKEDRSSSSESQTDSEIPSLDKFLVKHTTKFEREVYEAKKVSKDVSTEETRLTSSKFDWADGNPKRGAQAGIIPDLGSILVKHPSRLEKEIEEAKRNAGTSFETSQKGSNRNLTSSEPIPGLGNLLVKRHTSKLEKEIEETKRNCGKMYENIKRPGKTGTKTARFAEIPSLDNFLVKHVSKLEKEIQEAKKRSKADIESRNSTALEENTEPLTAEVGKENVNLNKDVKRNFELAKKENKTELEAEEELKAGGQLDSLAKILVRPMHRLEREKIQALASGTAYGNQRLQQKKQQAKTESDYDSLDKILVKRVSRLEKEKRRFNTNEEMTKVGKEDKEDSRTNNEGGLDLILVKHKPRLEREKTAAAAAAKQLGEQTKLSVARRQARDRELQETWGGLGLGNSIRPSLSKLEREKAAWIKAEEEERKRVTGAI